MTDTSRDPTTDAEYARKRLRAAMKLAGYVDGGDPDILAIEAEVSRAVLACLLDCDCHSDPEMDHASCDYCTGKSEAERSERSAVLAAVREGVEQVIRDATFPKQYTLDEGAGAHANFLLGAQEIEAVILRDVSALLDTLTEPSDAD